MDATLEYDSSSIESILAYAKRLEAIRSGRNARDWSESRTHIKEGGRSATRLKSTTSIMKSIATLMRILPKLELS